MQGNANIVILGMSIKRNHTARTLSISQEKYLESLLNRFEMEGCKPMPTPLDRGKKFHKRTDEEEQCDQSIYQQAIGCPPMYQQLQELTSPQQLEFYHSSRLAQARIIGQV